MQIELSCTVNGVPRKASVYPMARLLDVLREQMRLTPTKRPSGKTSPAERLIAPTRNPVHILYCRPQAYPSPQSQLKIKNSKFPTPLRPIPQLKIKN